MNTRNIFLDRLRRELCLPKKAAKQAIRDFSEKKTTDFNKLDLNFYFRVIKFLIVKREYLEALPQKEDQFLQELEVIFFMLRIHS
jgi:hypothetical protein